MTTTFVKQLKGTFLIPFTSFSVLSLFLFLISQSTINLAEYQSFFQNPNTKRNRSQNIPQPTVNLNYQRNNANNQPNFSAIPAPSQSTIQNRNSQKRQTQLKTQTQIQQIQTQQTQQRTFKIIPHEDDSNENLSISLVSRDSTKRIHLRRVFGYFRCDECFRKWQSAHTWILNDNIKLTQKCNNCRDEGIEPYETAPLQSPLVLAFFRCEKGHKISKELRKNDLQVVQKLFCHQCKRLYELKSYGFEENMKIDLNQPHHSELCSACKLLFGDCTKIYQYS